MVDKAKDYIPDFIKERSKKVMDQMGKVEDSLEKARDRMNKNVDKIDTKEVKKVYDDVLKRVRTARGEMEKAFNTGMDKTLAALNLPSKAEVDKIKKDLAKLNKAVNELKKKPAKKAAKKTAKKTTKKKAKKAPKKAAKKTAKK